MVRLLRAWFRLILTGMGLVLLLGCNPYSPDEGYVGDVPVEETTDNFSITVNYRNEVTQILIPIMDAVVTARFIDTDNRDNEGNYLVRVTVYGVTDPAGVWSTTVTYPGIGDLAADKVLFYVVHDAYYPTHGQAVLQDNQAQAAVVLVPDS